LLLQALQVPHLAPFRGHIRDLRASPISFYFAYRFIKRDRASPYTLPHPRSLPKGSGSIVVAT